MVNYIEELKRIRCILSGVTGLQDDDQEYIEDAYKGVNSLIEQREKQEPVAWINWSALTGERRLGWECESEIASEPLYTTPPAAPVQEPVDIYGILACSVECSVFENQVAPVLELNGFGQKAAPTLEKPKPQYWTRKRMGYDREYCEKPFTTDWEPLYTTPPAAQRQLVGLTDEEYEKAIRDNMLLQMNFAGIRDDIEAKLRENNT